MPRSKLSPSSNAIHWTDEEEKAEALALIPDGESLSNYVRRVAFKLPALKAGRPKQDDGVRLHGIKGKLIRRKA